MGEFRLLTATSVPEQKSHSVCKSGASDAVFLSNAIGTPPIVLGFVLEHRGQTQRT